MAPETAAPRVEREDAHVPGVDRDTVISWFEVDWQDDSEIEQALAAGDKDKARKLAMESAHVVDRFGAPSALSSRLNLNYAVNNVFGRFDKFEERLREADRNYRAAGREFRQIEAELDRLKAMRGEADLDHRIDELEEQLERQRHEWGWRDQVCVDLYEEINGENYLSYVESKAQAREASTYEGIGKTLSGLVDPDNHERTDPAWGGISLRDRQILHCLERGLTHDEVARLYATSDVPERQRIAARTLAESALPTNAPASEVLRSRKPMWPLGPAQHVQGGTAGPVGRRRPGSRIRSRKPIGPWRW